MGPQGRISVPAESAGDLGGPTSRSDIFLDDVSVSRRHVELRWEKDDFHDHAAPFSGKWYHTESAINEPRYRDHIPVMLGGSDEKKTFRLAARYGDHLNLITPMSELRHKLDVRVGLQSCLYTLHPVMRRKAHVGQRRRDLCGAAIELTDRLATELRSFNAVRSTRLCTTVR